MTGAAAEEVVSLDKWNAVKERRRTELRRMLGLYPYPPRTPLNAKVTGTLKRDGYTIEKMAFESMPGMYVSANLYLPAAPGRKPTIVYVCGHKESQFGAKTGYQQPVIMLAKNGYVTLTIDPIQMACNSVQGATAAAAAMAFPATSNLQVAERQKGGRVRIPPSRHT